MASCRWVDVVSSDSCASFGRSALLTLDRPNRAALRASVEQLVASLDAESLESLRQSISDQQLAMGESFLELSRQYTMMDARTGVTLEMQQKMRLTHDFMGGGGEDDHHRPLTQRDIVNSIYNSISTADHDPIDDVPLTPADVKEGSTGLVSFSGFLCMQQSSQTSMSQSPSRPESLVATEANSPKDVVNPGSSGVTPEPVLSPSTSTSTSTTTNNNNTKESSAKTKVVGTIGKGAAVPAKMYKNSSSKKEAVQLDKKVKKVDFSSPIKEGGREEEHKAAAVASENVKRQKGSGESPTGIYFDDNTKLPLNPPKKAHVAKIDQEHISKLLLSQFNQSETKPKPKDAQGDRIYSRLKDIAIGKSTKGYQNYIKKVPIDQRSADDPQTPNLRENISAARFQVIYRKWRTSLHKYDNV